MISLCILIFSCEVLNVRVLLYSNTRFPLLAENLSNEERTWEEIMQIKAMPVSMMQKKELKAKLQVGHILVVLHCIIQKQVTDSS